jgi:hypothetical protein
MRHWLVAIPFCLFLGCGGRAVPIGENGTSNTGQQTFGINVCSGTAPRALFNGEEQALEPVKAVAPMWQGDWRNLPAYRRYYVFEFPLRDSTLAKQLDVTIEAPRLDDGSFSENLARPSQGFELKVEGTPRPWVAVQDPLVFSLSEEDTAQGSLVVQPGETKELVLQTKDVVSLCIRFARTSSWFRPETVVLYAPNLRTE